MFFISFSIASALQKLARSPSSHSHRWCQCKLLNFSGNWIRIQFDRLREFYTTQHTLNGRFQFNWYRWANFPAKMITSASTTYGYGYVPLEVEANERAKKKSIADWLLLLLLLSPYNVRDASSSIVHGYAATCATIEIHFWCLILPLWIWCAREMWNAIDGGR